jgi:quinol monooxygenase YgiN
MSRFALILALSTALILPAGQNTKSAEALSKQSAAVTGDGNDIFHVAIFRFAKQHIRDATAAFRELAMAARREPGNLEYDIYRSKDDDQAFYIVEHWVSPAALSAHERSEAFTHFGHGVLVKYATLHDTVTASAFDVATSPLPNR